MAGIVLDASALLAMLRSEPGGDLVADRLGEARMSVVNHAEVVSHYARAGAASDAIGAMLRPLPIQLVPADEHLALSAGLLGAVTAEAGLSLGDRFCLASGGGFAVGLVAFRHRRTACAALARFLYDPSEHGDCPIPRSATAIAVSVSRTGPRTR